MSTLYLSKDILKYIYLLYIKYIYGLFDSNHFKALIILIILYNCRIYIFICMYIYNFYERFKIFLTKQILKIFSMLYWIHFN